MIGWLRRLLDSPPEAGEWAVAMGEEKGNRSWSAPGLARREV